MADITMTQTQMEAIPIQFDQVASVGLKTRKFISPDWFQLEWISGPDGQGNWIVTESRIVLLNFSQPEPVNFKGQTVGAVGITLATFPIPTNIFGKTKIEVLIVNVANGDSDNAEIIAYWKRFGGAPTVYRTVSIVALSGAGTLSGITLPALSVSSNSIVSSFNGKAGVTIDVYARFTPMILKF